jgi:hypothetical protein
MCDGGCAVVVRTLLLWREALLLLTASCQGSSLLYLAVCLDHCVHVVSFSSIDERAMASMDEWIIESSNTRIVLCQPCDDPLLHDSVWVGVGKTSYQPSIFTATSSAYSRIGLMRKVWMEVDGSGWKCADKRGMPARSFLSCIASSEKGLGLGGNAS